MVQRYEARKDYFGNVILPPKNDEGELVLYSDYAALEQRFNALSTKFSAMVEENAALERERDELKAENATLRKRLDESNRNDFLSQALNEGVDDIFKNG